VAHTPTCKTAEAVAYLARTRVARGAQSRGDSVLLTGRADKCANVDGEERLLLDGREPVHRARACEQRRKLLRRSTTGGVHVGSAAFGDKCESSKLGVVGSAWHRPASTYAAADGAGAIHRLTAPEDTGPLPRPLSRGRRQRPNTCRVPLPSSGARPQGRGAADAPASARVRRAAFGWTCGYGIRGRRNAATAPVPRIRHKNVLGSRNQRRPHRG
jgi:hypothetical protein